MGSHINITRNSSIHKQKYILFSFELYRVNVLVTAPLENIMAMFDTRDIPYGSAQTELQQVTENQALSRDWATRTAQCTAKLSILTSSNSHYPLTHVLGSYEEQSMNGCSVLLCRNTQQHQKKK